MFKKIWKLLEGSKTAIGLALMHVSSLIPDPTIGQVVDVAGQVIAGIGGTDKARRGAVNVIRRLKAKRDLPSGIRKRRK